MLAALQFAAVIDVGRPDAEGAGAVRNIGAVADTEAIAGSDGRAESGEA